MDTENTYTCTLNEGDLDHILILIGITIENHEAVIAAATEAGDPVAPWHRMTLAYYQGLQERITAIKACPDTPQRG